MTSRKVTQKDAAEQINKLGFSLFRDGAGDFVVYVKGTSRYAPANYYTPDLDDAVGTARMMRQAIDHAAAKAAHPYQKAA
jgi:hypothetical protein